MNLRVSTKPLCKKITRKLQYFIFLTRIIELCWLSYSPLDFDFLKVLLCTVSLACPYSRKWYLIVYFFDTLFFFSSSFGGGILG